MESTKKLSRGGLPLVLLVVGIAACAQQDSRLPEVSDGARLLDVGGGVSVEVVDWGGVGRPVVFLAGGGHTAHEFDDFAPLLTPDFHVLGITRRGAGASSDVPPKSIGDHVHDIVTVLDSLGLEGAVLVGHSFAGMEMALFATEHAERCTGLVYLDSAYDYTDPAIAELFQKTPPPQAPPMEAADSASLEAVQAYVRRTQGITMPVAEIRTTRRFDESGRMSGMRHNTSMRVPPRSPEWNRITCPSLGIYAMPAPLETWLPYYEVLDSASRERGHAYYEAFAAWTAANRERFGRVPTNQVVEFPSSSHYFFLEQPEEAARVIREWVAARR